MSAVGDARKRQTPAAEPAGLGAVVIDVENRAFVRITANGFDAWPWRQATGKHAGARYAWANLTVSTDGIRAHGVTL